MSQTDEVRTAGCPNDLRALGWSVAVHNDYRQDGAARTFWLLTHPCGRWAKGEGRTDAEALDQCRAAIAGMTEAAPAEAAGPIPDGHGTRERDARAALSRLRRLGRLIVDLRTIPVDVDCAELIRAATDGCAILHAEYIPWNEVMSYVVHHPDLAELEEGASVPRIAAVLNVPEGDGARLRRIGFSRC